ncbi:copper resistance protein NlpE [Chryseobacterium sp. MYb264]|uniref:copper resistance protein NlpE n=1 Tax=Chryseobacterium sp. MYb264 TaxID=2745153 RepID=UPI002E0E7B0F|nr:copper resistance protein NlpE [Chryseobacterium sp. MYb264]
MNAPKILGIAAIVLMVSCTQKDKNPEVNPKTDPMAIQTPMDTVAVDTAKTSDNFENSLDWQGTYEAVVPCADCPGIKTVVTLNKDRTFRISEEYLERKGISEEKGTFEWDAGGSVITLKGKNTHYKYKVGENTITQLDMSGKPIDGPNKKLYVFTKK